MKVIDAAALGAVVFDEPEAERVLSETDGEELQAPLLLRFELTDVAWRKSRQRPDAAALVAEHLRDALTLPLTLVDVDHDAVLRLAVKHKITAYDANDLWLARHLGATLVTLDRGLRRLATRS